MTATLVSMSSNTTSSGELGGNFSNFETFLRSPICFLCTNITFGNSQIHYDKAFTVTYLGPYQTSAMEHLSRFYRKCLTWS